MNKLIIILSLVLMIAMLSSCTVDNSAMLEELMGSVSENKNDYEYHYGIIIPSKASPTLIGYAEALVSEIADNIGIDAILKYDGVKYPNDEDEIKIYFGYSETDIAIGAMRYFREEDYFCGCVGDSYVIGGKTDEASSVALERFLSDILPRLKSENILDIRESILFKGEYEIKKSYLNGYLLEEYCIVYDENVGEAEAEFLSRIICERSGYILDVCSEKDFTSKYGGRAIYLSSDLERYGYVLSDEGYILNNSKGIVVLSDDKYQRCSAMDKFCDLLFENVNSESETRLSILEDIRVKTDTFDITYVSYAGNSNVTDSANYSSGVIKKLESYDADIMFMTAYSNFDVQFLCASLPKEYSVLHSFNALDMNCVMIYRNDRWSGDKTTTLNNGANITVMYEFSDLNTGEDVVLAYSFGDNVDGLINIDKPEKSVSIYELRSKKLDDSVEEIKGFHIESSKEYAIGAEKTTVTRYISQKLYAKDLFESDVDEDESGSEVYREIYSCGKYRKEYNIK
ncbi:MAG: hypothetical protein J6Q78_01150 [Clostridia bacterium]|nr:hypothetical protein [Clostridia bacterium]